MTEDFYIHRWFMHVFDMPGDQTDTCTNNMIKALRWRKDENIRGMYLINCKFLVGYNPFSCIRSLYLLFECTNHIQYCRNKL